MRFKDGEHGTWRRCFTHDISVTGLFLESSRIPRSDRVELEVSLDDDDHEPPVRLVGELVHGMRVPARLLRSVRGGFAVKLLDAPAPWYEYCLALGRPRSQTG